MMCGFGVLAALLMLVTSQAPADYAIDKMPEGYYLQAYDDCGIPGRQPHFLKGPDTTTHTFTRDQVPADEKARSVITNPRQIDAVYPGVDPQLEYVLAVVYANEPFNNRSQSLWAGPVPLHGPHPLPKGKTERLLFRVPAQAVAEGTLALHFKLEAEVNVVVSVVELWAPAPSPSIVYLSGVNGLVGPIEGNVLGLSYDGLADVDVQLVEAGEEKALTKTGPDGYFTFARDLFDTGGTVQPLEVIARLDGAEARHRLERDDLYFEPVRYRPMPAQVDGLNETRLSLNGPWQIATQADPPATGTCQVPGQWLQQGYDVPLDQHVTMTREFRLPKEWQGRRIFLRFDAIHAGARYYLNDTLLGYSENLFTPVEWEITQYARPDQTNVLRLDMVVDTVSEKLSYSCGYAFHNLGGIDRSVWLYALPQINVRSLQIDAGLDEHYTDGILRINADVDNPGGNAEDVELETSLYAQGDTPVALAKGESSNSFRAAPGITPVSLTATVHNPLKWNAEKPALYTLVAELKQHGRVLERMERLIGFRKIEIKAAQLYVNGQRVKLAGACHHELDPLTGRADTGRLAELDVLLLKQANLNYIRTSHYPPTQELLDAADRIGMYVEVEAPFCWVAPSEDLTPLRQVLTPTSAMIDYHGGHPSVIIWSLANESAFNRFFEIANNLCKQLGPTRPTTFNNPDPERVCDIANLHYAPMPYDEQIKDDPRPVFLGEYFFPICHEQTDVMINPGLRELWGHGHSRPDSEWGRYCAQSFDQSYTHPGTPPGAWTHIYNSNRLIGGAIWAAIDEPYYLPDGRNVGYAWHHGFWGLIDAWRRPKTEWYLAKNIFSPVWFPARDIESRPGETNMSVPVENRYSFTNLSELTFVCNGATCVSPDVAPGTKGSLTILANVKAPEMKITVCRGADEIVTAQIGTSIENERPLPKPDECPPVQEDGALVVLGERNLALVFDRVRGEFNAGDPRHTAAVSAFPRLHVTRFDFGDLAPEPPYAVLPDPATRAIDRVEVKQQPDGVAMTVHDHYVGSAGAAFSGYTRWIIGRNGAGSVSYDYAYSGVNLNAREVGIKFVLKPGCDQLQWNRWSEWGDFPIEAICRANGIANARRDPALGDVPESRKPAWPWALDQTELGTNDFRSVKFNIYESSLVSKTGSGLAAHANADAHVRTCLDPQGVFFHILSECRLGPVSIAKGDHIKGEFVIVLLPQTTPAG
ncbi:MAG TPA: glycoside hydrolase family 2 TIM barrel-domain containing protein [Candidatus Bathyarchaeia archaeon]|nr:glycoside hydrolase family 2 TIM barrel-domain containing protein [Candidatus Bathyarchaeia archaeon]